MSKFSCYEILKSNAKELKRAHGIMLSEAQERIAKQAGFSHFHELSVVAKKDPLENRLMVAALGVSDLSEALYEDNIYVELDQALEEQLSGAIADTNADNFSMDGDEEITEHEYDESTGMLTLKVSLTYLGDQHPDRVYAGSAFYLDTIVRLVRRNNKWEFAEDGLEIINGESDQDRDWAAQEGY
ncbi:MULTISPECIES: hypothetical protein [unclassified Serratia (in: enterobacteria)]|uniref:hypothetical protein n=1 Tax=unclassified Serratia (in: enterobacteria) TaxID=2647522 RepID=UPI0030760270